VLVRKEEGTEDLPLPTYMTDGSSGMDLFCAENDSIVLNPSDTKLVSAGIYISIPYGFEAQIRPRSGLALKHGITILNSPGTIDSDYRGLISVIMTNLGKETFQIKRGLRIAQMVIQPVFKANIERVDSLDNTARQEGGFGHTGS